MGGFFGRNSPAPLLVMRKTLREGTKRKREE
jgi:hypothetical protein